MQSVRDSHVSNQLLRNAAPLSPHPPSLSTPRRFPQPDVPSGSGTQFMLHRLRTTASRLWLYVAPHSTLVGAVTGLSYPSTPDFSRCQLRQVSPCSPRMSPYAQKPSCAVRVTPFRYVPRVGLAPTFTWSQVNRPFPACRRFRVAQPHTTHPVVWIGSKEGVTPSSALRSRTSSIRSMRLQRLLDSRLAIWNLPGWRPGVSFRTCVFAVWQHCSVRPPRPKAH